MYTKFEQIINEKNYKLADVARGAGITYSTLTDWKAGRSKPKIDKLQKIADFLGVSVEIFLPDKKPEENIPTINSSLEERILQRFWNSAENIQQSICILLEIDFEEVQQEKKERFPA